MSRASSYPQIIIHLLQQIAQESDSTNPKPHLILDHTRNHFMLFTSGWEHIHRIRIPTLYIRLHQEKIWIEEDFTAGGFAQKLHCFGVPYHDMVLAFHHPTIRPYTRFTPHNPA